MEESINYDNCDIVMSSESLLFCLKYPYGYDTTDISGRIQKPVNGKHSNFYNFFRIDQLKSRGHEMTVGYLIKVGIRKLMTKVGLIKQ
jgi:hypothetical protein